MSLVLGNTPKLRNQTEIYLYIHKRMYGNNFESKLLRSLLLINILQETIVGHAIPSPHLYIVCEPMAIKKFFYRVFSRGQIRMACDHVGLPSLHTIYIKYVSRHVSLRLTPDLLFVL